MVGADKRAKLLSDLLAAKGGAAGAAAQPAEPERAAVIPIAKRRASDERASEAPAAPGVLYSKGAATASTFRPSYWSFDHEQQAEPKSVPALPESAPPSAPMPAAPVAQPPKSRPLPINLVVAFGCVALCVSTGLFVLSQQNRVEIPAAPPTPSTTAAAPAPMPAPAPMTPLLSAPAESVAALPTPAPNPGPAAPAPAAMLAPPTAPAAVAPPPTPVASAPAPVASDPPPATAEPAAKSAPPSPPAVVASAPAPGPASAVDTQQAEALLARGDDLLATGDVAAARLFYQRAAELGSGAAATAVGQTYDPGVLELLRVRGARGDMQMAAEWYRKAIAAGDRQAEIRLKRLLARLPG